MTVPRPIAPVAVAVLAVLTLAACGSEDPQDANEPTGEFEVEVTTSRFPTSQRLADTGNLVLGVENTGEATVPELAFTISTSESGEGAGGGTAGNTEGGSGAGEANGSFNIRSDQPGLANPNRPVWVLESKYPREVGTPPPTGLSGGFRAQTNTFAFGPLEPGEEKEIVWRLTPVMAGTYTLSYIVAAGLDGNAKAVTSNGGEVKGEFVVEITDKPPRARVNDRGEVVTQGE